MFSPSLSIYTPTPSATTSFSTPHQRHYSPTSPLAVSFTPQTPSPLRTSRNANLMPPPQLTKSSPLASTENAWDTASPDENVFIFTPSTKESSYSRRSRSHSPITELNTRTSAARDRRKSLFLEQLRSRREDEKFEARGEQILRMDWEREEAARRAGLARHASGLEMDVDEMMMDEEVEEQEQGGLSLTEERELEELIGLHEEALGRGDGEEDLMGDLDEDEYEQLLMQLVDASQERDSQLASGQSVLLSQQNLEVVSGQHGGGNEDAGESMDMS